MLETDPQSLGGSTPSNSTYNPWLDVRLDADFRRLPSTTWVTVPGFFAGNGVKGSVPGNVWKARFTPFGAPGTWEYRVRAWVGAGANLTPLGSPPTSAPVVDFGGTHVTVAAPMSAEGFLRKGILRHVGERYFRFENGESFLKTGSGGPENFLAYREFTGWASHDQTSPPPPSPAGLETRLETCMVPNPGYPSTCANATWSVTGVIETHRVAAGHLYPVHAVQDWTPNSDPSWGPSGQPKGRGIIGALNYLGSKGVNSIYMLVMNLGGDSRDVAPFADIGTNACVPNASVKHYSVARMREWNIVFEHAMRKGIALDLVLAEQELPNIQWLGGSALTGGNAMSEERKLFLKQMVAMFAHNHAVKWVLTEELLDEDTVRVDANGYCTYGTFSRADLTAMSEWIRDWDVYAHPITVHTTGFPWVTYDKILNDTNPTTGANPAWLSATSLQVGGEKPANPYVDYGKFSSNYSWFPRWVRALFESHPQADVTPVDIDENGHFAWGASRDTGSNHPLIYGGPNGLVVTTGDPTLNNRHDRRKRILYDVLFAGAGLAWYYGGAPAVYAGSDLGGDHSLEDFDTRLGLFSDTERARKLITEYPTTGVLRPEWWLWEPMDEIVVTGCNSIGSNNDYLGGIVNSYWAAAGLSAAFTNFVQPYLAFGDPTDTQACVGIYGQPRAFARRNGDALVYYPALTSGAGSLQMDRSWEGGLTEAKYAARWWDPRNGAFMADPPVVFAVDSSGAAVPMAIPSSILNPTFMASEDYVLVVERVQ